MIKYYNTIAVSIISEKVWSNVTSIAVCCEKSITFDLFFILLTNECFNSILRMYFLKNYVKYSILKNLMVLEIRPWEF